MEWPELSIQLLHPPFASVSSKFRRFRLATFDIYLLAQALGFRFVLTPRLIIIRQACWFD